MFRCTAKRVTQRAAAEGPGTEGAVPPGAERTSTAPAPSDVWTWALVAALAGAAAGASAAVLVRRALRVDPENAQDPADVEAVVDRAPLREAGPGPATSSGS